MSDPVGNEIITAAERVLRELNDGREPYAPSVMPMARALAKLARDPQFILAAVETLMLRDEFHDIALRAEGAQVTRADVTDADLCHHFGGSLYEAYAKLKAARNA